MNIYIIKNEYLSIMAEASTNTCMMAPAAWILWIIVWSLTVVGCRCNSLLDGILHIYYHSKTSLL